MLRRMRCVQAADDSEKELIKEEEDTAKEALRAKRRNAAKKERQRRRKQACSLHVASLALLPRHPLNSPVEGAAWRPKQACHCQIFTYGAN